MMLKWLTNTRDPKLPKRLLEPEADEAWLADKIYGKPKATPFCSVDELEAMGLVGVYMEVADVS